MSLPVHPRYNDPMYSIGSSDTGRDLLGGNGLYIRNKIGGNRLFTRRVTRRNKYRSHRKKTKGGFIPSIMEPFITSVSKYIVPIVLYSGYKLMTRGKKTKKHNSRRK